MIQRDNFSSAQKTQCLEQNSNQVRIRWKEEFSSLPKDAEIYMCEYCGFVSRKRNYFEVDHLVSCKEGGTANRETIDNINRIKAELDRPLDKQEVGILALANLNWQVLCIGCNQGKKGGGMRADDIPAGCGYAYAKRDEDENPEHRYSGPPPVVGFVKPRYRKNLTR
jgi:hypothetical protein